MFIALKYIDCVDPARPGHTIQFGVGDEVQGLPDELLDRYVAAGIVADPDAPQELPDGAQADVPPQGDPPAEDPADGGAADDGSAEELATDGSPDEAPAPRTRKKTAKKTPAKKRSTKKKRTRK